jgi:hypothetical protein
LKRYIGVKIVHAEPAWQTRLIEDSEVVVFVAKSEYLPGIEGLGQDTQDGYKVVYPDGYNSWCPKKAFEEANRETDAMPFGMAVEVLRKGLRVARKGWNGKGMWLEYFNAHDWTICSRFPYVVPEKDLLPWIGMKTVDDKYVPWLASQTDILADDWQIVE